VDNDPNNSKDPYGLCNDPCDNVPKHPTDANVYQNMFQAQDNGGWWWYGMARQGGGAWDYKYYHGQPHPEYDNFGNFNYGATGCAAGVPLWALL
jgi:type VI secretion system secreted protein VgrG